MALHLLRSQKGSLRTLVSSCRLPVRQALVTDVTQGQFKLLDDFFCIALPFWRELQGDRVGLGVSAADASGGAGWSVQRAAHGALSGPELDP